MVRIPCQLVWLTRLESPPSVLMSHIKTQPNRLSPPALCVLHMSQHNIENTTLLYDVFRYIFCEFSKSILEKVKIFPLLRKCTMQYITRKKRHISSFFADRCNVFDLRIINRLKQSPDDNRVTARRIDPDHADIHARRID